MINSEENDQKRCNQEQTGKIGIVKKIALFLIPKADENWVHYK